jgi:dihydrofolate reductase
LTHRDIKIEGINVIHSIDEILNLDDLWVIGGAQIYKLMLPYADYLYVSLIKGDYVGDTYFPEVDYSLFDLESKKESEVASYLVYKRK